MERISHYVLDLNPEPWAIGDVSAGRKDGRLTGRISPNPNLVAFQNAVREALDGEEKLPEGQYKLTFYFFRQQARYLDAADHIRQRNQADATNMQKGLEDALQGVLFDNDRDVKDIRSVIIEQGPKVIPCIVIEAQLLTGYEDYNLPKEVAKKMKEILLPKPRKSSYNSWPPK